MRAQRHVVAVLVLCMAGLMPEALRTAPAGGQQRGDDRLKAFERHRALARTSPFTSQTWQFLGPTNIAGRVNDVAVAVTGPRRRIYAAFSGSGLWVTDNNGETWRPVFTDAAATAINAVAVAPSNPSMVWILTGTHRSHIPLASAGVFKSVDAGRSWTHMGLTDVGQGGAGRIAIHPRQSETVYVAVSGGPTSSNTRGLFKTTNGGRHWERILDTGRHTGVGDVLMDPANPDVIYATTRPRARGNEVALILSLPNEPRFSVYRSRDAGKSWHEIGKGLPEPRVRFNGSLEINPSRPNVLYSLIDVRREGVQTGPPELFRSDDYGDTWQTVSAGGDRIESWIRGIKVDPHNDRTLVAFGVRVYVSHDEGASFRRIDGPHVDHNAFVFDRMQPGIAYDATDGGLYVHDDPGSAWTLTPSLPTAQVYAVSLDHATPFRVYAAIQDQHSFRGTVDIRLGRNHVPAVAFERAPGEEVTPHVLDPEGRYLYVATTYNGRALQRYDLRPDPPTVTRVAATVITPRPAADDPPLRGAWFIPIAVSPFDARTLYTGYQALYRSRNAGGSWERISPTLSGDAPQGRPSVDYSNIAVQAISESPRRRGLIYVGTDDGRLHVSADDGKSRQNLTENLPHRTWIFQAMASRHDDATVYVVDRARDDDDFGAYVYRSRDYGKTFTSIAANLPYVPVNVIREDPTDARLLYVGTDFGVYISIDAGTRWHVLGKGFPPVPVTDIQIHPRDQVMVVSTFGRGIWVLDAVGVRRATGVNR